jgi:hypothetical protein
MPIQSTTLLTDLKKWVTRFEDDLRQQCKDVPALDTRLKVQYKLAKDGGRTAFSYAVWRDGELTQSAVGWVLSCVFVRFLEDNDLLERTYLSGVGENREAADETRAAYFRENRAASDNDYLAHVVGEVGKLPGMADLMDARHNALWNAAISPDAAKSFIEFWRRIDPGTGKMAHEFTDSDWDTRFLGDLYQDLSEAARKKFALLQTPDFVEEFILDRTLDPAINTFGLKVVRMIDPTCGSGHFLLGGFRRLLALWEKERPDLSDKERAVKALDGVFGVDINPFAVAIARFRLLLAAWRYCEVKRLRSAPDFKVNLAVGDSLLHGARFDAEGKPYTTARESLFGGDELVFKDETAHHFEVEDAKELHRILGQQYHAVVGNPPYITVKDAALNKLYRERYDSCSGKYALSVPFLERFFDLAVAGTKDRREPAGYTGQITSNSFIKREFGKKIIQEHMPNWDVTHVVDTSNAYIPGHGTPTVIIFGRTAKPITDKIRTVMGIKGEPSTPVDPAQGCVWTAIVNQIDRPGSESDFVSVGDTEREKFYKHPWSIGGGGAAELKTVFDEDADQIIGRIADSIGFLAIPGDDDVFVTNDRATWVRHGIDLASIWELVTGDVVRDFTYSGSKGLIFPYNYQGEYVGAPTAEAQLWRFRGLLARAPYFGKTKEQRGLNWREFAIIMASKFKSSLALCFTNVATHNHFVLERGGHIFNSHAPVIKLPADASEDEHLRLLGLLNSSAACFWMQQVFHNKGGPGGGSSKDEKWHDFYEIDGTKLKQFPVPVGSPLILASGLDCVAKESLEYSPDALAAADTITSAELIKAEQRAAEIRARMISLQEELDWQCYHHYGLIDTDDHLEWPEDRLDNLPPLNLGERAFEIGMARQIAEGELETKWFRKLGAVQITELPAHWPDDYRALVERRLAFIEENRNINLIERTNYKRRWEIEPWAKRQQAALEKWLLTRLETYFHDTDRMVSGEDEATTTAKLAHIRPLRARFAGGTEPRLVSVRQLAQTAQADSQWMEAATVFAGRADFDVAKLVETLVLAESVPALPLQRYKPAGLRKREEWEKTWELQRAEDAVEEEVRGQKSGVSEEELKKKIRKAQLEKVGDIPVPPKYGSGDFLKSSYWKLRGKLDVPKERWVVYPGMEGGHDASPVIAWAGWDHAQQAAALTAFYQQAKDTWGWESERRAPLLAALKELLPWLHQWHNAIDPEYGDRISTTYQQFYETERHTLRMTDEDIEKIRMGATL